MTRTVTLALATVVADLPAAVASTTGYRYALTSTTPGATPAVINTTDLSAEFDNVDAGAYIASVVSLDQDGNPFDTPLTIPVTVTEVVVPPPPPPPPATYAAPSALTYTLS